MTETTRRVQLVWAHPREDSLTARIVADAREAIEARGIEVDEVDLYRMRLDPVLREADEPDWEDLDKVYDPETMELIARTAQADALVFVFPVWWYAFPAIMKGYIDRVWNLGRFYGGGRSIGIDSVLWLPLVGLTEASFRKRDYDRMMEHYLNIGIADYCGFSDSRTEFLYNTLGEDVDHMPAHVAALREQARGAVEGLLARAAAQRM